MYKITKLYGVTEQKGIDALTEFEKRQLKDEIENLKKHPRNHELWCTEPYAPQSGNCEDCKMWNKIQRDCKKYCD